MPGKSHARAVAKIKKRQRARNTRTKKSKTPKEITARTPTLASRTRKKK